MLYAATDAADPDHRPARETVEHWPGELVVSAFTAAEADHLILSRLGVDSELAFLADLSDGYVVDSLDGPALANAAAVCERYRDLEIGLADASIVILAQRWSTNAVATFDERHFRAMERLESGPFRILPSDR